MQCPRCTSDRAPVLIPHTYPENMEWVATYSCTDCRARFRVSVISDEISDEELLAACGYGPQNPPIYPKQYVLHHPQENH